MKGAIKLRAGVPDEANRDYLPLVIKESQIVVNENGNNSQPYPERLVEKKANWLGDGLEDTWYEYVPETYDPSKKTPLVVSCHGGLMNGWGQCIYTSWTYIADREGFIVVFPSASEPVPGDFRFWKMTARNGFGMGRIKIGGIETPDSPKSDDENHDIQFILKMIADVKSRYNIDDGRVYIQGMSMGGMMSTQMIGYSPETFAAYATAGAPGAPAQRMDMAGNILAESIPVSHFMSMPEHNGWDKDPAKCRDQRDSVRNTIRFWKQMNGIDCLPLVSIQGEDNYAFYKGEKGNLVIRDIRNRDHGQTLDDAELVWSYMFSGTRRNPDGTITSTETDSPYKSDDFGIMIFDGLDKAYVNSKPVQMKAPVKFYQKLKYHGLDGGEKVRGEYFVVPVSFIAEVIGAEYTTTEEGKCAQLVLKDGRTVSFALGSIGCVVDNKLYSMDCEAQMVENELSVPAEWFFRRLLNLQTSTTGNALYITDHYTELSTHMAMIVEDVLRS